jgi:hypothetical protein
METLSHEYTGNSKYDVKPFGSVQWNEIYTISFVRLTSLILPKGTSGGTVPYRSTPGVGVNVNVTVPDTVPVAVGAGVAESLPPKVDVAVALEVPVMSGASVAVSVGALVALGLTVCVKVGSGVCEAGRSGVGSIARVCAACVPASAIVVACESPAEIGEKTGKHALRARDKTRTTNDIRRLIHTSWGLRLRDDFHELREHIPQHAFGERAHLSVNHLASRNE